MGISGEKKGGLMEDAALKRGPYGGCSFFAYN